MGISLSYYTRDEFNTGSGYWRMIVDGVNNRQTAYLEDLIPVRYEPRSFVALKYYNSTKNTVIEYVGENFYLNNARLIEALDILHDIDTTGINVFHSRGKLFYASKIMPQEELENVKYYKWGYQKTSGGGTIVSKYGQSINLVTKLDIEPEFEMDAFIMSDSGTTLYYGEEKVHTNIRTLTGLIKKYSKST